MPASYFMSAQQQPGMVPISYQFQGSPHMMSVERETSLANYKGGGYEDDLHTEQHHKSDNYNRLLFQSQHIANHPDDNSSVQSSQIMNIRKIKLSDNFSMLQQNMRKKKTTITSAVNNQQPL